MDSRQDTQPSNYYMSTQKLQNRLTQIKTNRQELAKEKKEFLNNIKEQKEKLSSHIEERFAPFNFKAQILKKTMDDELRSAVFFYDYLPLALTVFQLIFSSKRDEVLHKLADISKDGEEMLQVMLPLKEKALRIEKKLDDLAQQPELLEMKLIEEENQIVKKIFENNTAGFFQSSAGPATEIEKKPLTLNNLSMDRCSN